MAQHRVACASWLLILFLKLTTLQAERSYYDGEEVKIEVGDAQDTRPLLEDKDRVEDFVHESDEDMGELAAIMDEDLEDEGDIQHDSDLVYYAEDENGAFTEPLANPYGCRKVWCKKCRHLKVPGCRRVCKRATSNSYAARRAACRRKCGRRCRRHFWKSACRRVCLARCLVLTYRRVICRRACFKRRRICHVGICRKCDHRSGGKPTSESDRSTN